MSLGILVHGDRRGGILLLGIACSPWPGWRSCTGGIAWNSRWTERLGDLIV